MVSKTLFFAIGMALASCAAAQTMYKSVGPDGKITFSDTPPTSANAKVSTMGKPRAAPVPVEAATPKYISSGPIDAAAPQRTERMTRAMLKVIGMEHLIQQATLTCSRTEPSAAAKYAGMADNWRRRNAQAVDEQKRLLGDYPAAERRVMDALALEKTIGLMSIINNGSVPTRTKWCAQTYAEIESGRQDLR